MKPPMAQNPSSSANFVIFHFIKLWTFVSFLNINCQKEKLKYFVKIDSKGLVIFNPLVGGGRQVKGVKIFVDLLEGGSKNYTFLLRGG